MEEEPEEPAAPKRPCILPKGPSLAQLRADYERLRLTYEIASDDGLRLDSLSAPQ